MLNALFLCRSKPFGLPYTGSNLLTRSPVDLALALLLLGLIRWFIRFGACALRRMPPADTRRAIQSRFLAVARSDHVKCLHALSSFQRTGGPTRPDGFAAPQRCNLSLAEVPTFSTLTGRFWGNLPRLQAEPTLVKP